MTRRSLLLSTAAAASAASAATLRTGLKIGVTDWNLRLATKLEAIPLAARIGFSALEVSCGRKPINGKLPLDNPDLINQYRAAAAQHKITLVSTCLDILHVDGLKSSPAAPRWVSDSIRITRSLGARVILLPFFGDRQLKLQSERERVADLLRELAPEAEKANVTLGLENTNSAEENVFLLERARSRAVRVFYDTGNSAGQGYDVLKEIRFLGADRICQVHLKDNPHYLGQGPLDFKKILQAFADINYRGFADLETSSPSSAIESDMRRNLEFLRAL